MPDRKRLILHVGANKTGSSAIQRFLSLNCAALREEGFLIPNSKLEDSATIDGHHVPSMQDLMSRDSGRKALGQMIARLDETSGLDTILISAENLAANPRAPWLLAQIAESREVKVLIYIRRQDEYLLSSWQQWHSKTSADFWGWMVSAVGLLGNWKSYLEAWERAVPRDHINVRIYERSRLKDGDVISDFHSQIGVSTPMASLQRPDELVNPSYSDAIMELVTGNNAIFKDVHDNDFYNLVRQLTGDRYVRNNRESPITFEQRLAIIRRYDPSNLWVRQNYFPDESGDLFGRPARSSYTSRSERQIEAEKLEFLTTLVYNLARQPRGPR